MLSTDAIDLALDEDGDLVLAADGSPVLTSGGPGVAQGVSIAAKIVRGEVFTDIDRGVPYLERDGVTADQALLGQKFDAQRAHDAFAAAIATAPAITAVGALAVTQSSPTGISVAGTATYSFDDSVTGVVDVQVNA